MAGSASGARLSPRSFRGYSRLRKAIAGVLADCTHIAAQSEADARRFRELGASSDRVSMMGNIKFDMALPQAQIDAGRVLRQQAGRARVWIAASTHEGEEDAALTAHQRIIEAFPEALLIIVPRHPQRFDAVARLIEKRGMSCRRRSAPATDAARPAVFLGDSMGEMFLYFAMSDVAFVGGSLAPVGGHNVLEPAALSLPVLFGPHMHNFIAARDLLLHTGAAEQVDTAAALASSVLDLLHDAQRASAMGAAGAQAVAANRGALARLLALIDAHPLSY